MSNTVYEYTCTVDSYTYKTILHHRRLQVRFWT